MKKWQMALVLAGVSGLIFADKTKTSTKSDVLDAAALSALFSPQQTPPAPGSTAANNSNSPQHEDHSKIVHVTISNQSSDKAEIIASNKSKNVNFSQSVTDPITPIMNGSSHEVDVHYTGFLQNFGFKIVTVGQRINRGDLTFWEVTCKHHVFGSWSCARGNDSKPINANCKTKNDTTTCQIDLVDCSGAPKSDAKSDSFKVDPTAMTTSPDPAR